MDAVLHNLSPPHLTASLLAIPLHCYVAGRQDILMQSTQHKINMIHFTYTH